MATRSLTEVFILMRNNALQSRHILSEQCMDDRMALVHNKDPEQGISTVRDNKPPPDWVDGVEEVQYEISRIKQKVKELSILHEKYLTRPTLDDSLEEERAIEVITQEITQMFWHCQRLVHQINNKSVVSRGQESRVGENVVKSLVTSLQNLSNNFRRSQSTYLRKIKNREERSNHYFGSDFSAHSDYALMDEELLAEENLDRGFTNQQLKFVEDNTVMVQHREKEIIQIVRSITELNDIFKDLANIVVEQGTVLDRIDYNIENSQIQVSEGLKQLQKAEKYQKKNRKMLCILSLAVTTVILVIILIAVKS